MTYILLDFLCVLWNTNQYTQKKKKEGNNSYVEVGKSCKIDGNFNLGISST